jgi:acetyl esterase/lipase
MDCFTFLIKIMRVLSCIFCLLFLSTSILGQRFQFDEKIKYKSTKETDLYLHAFYPNKMKLGKPRPAIVFFFGGGWVGGNPRQFYQQATHFSKLGFVCFSAEYRVASRNKTSPFECVKDAKSAIRWVRKNAKIFNIDPNKIVSSGGSAGGHIASCTGVIEGFEEENEDLTISSMPNAMVLFNPVLDTSEKGYGSKKVKGRETEISPCHHVKEGIPPCIIFQGTADRTTPYENASRFDRLMAENKNYCDLIPFFNKDHGFFNSSFFRKTNKDEDYNLTMMLTEQFLWKKEFFKNFSQWEYVISNDSN